LALVGGIVVGAVMGFFRLFTFKAKSRSVPVIHEEVVLSPDGVKVWQQAAEPTSSVGKPVQHRRRRLTDGDATA
jgi:hypothetical protein